MLHKRSVIEALEKARVPYKTTRTSKIISIFCPFHKDTKSPSLTIYTDEPVHTHCFGCNHHGPWEDLAEALKLGKLRSDWEDPNACSNLDNSLAALANTDPCLPYRTKPWQLGPWRECSSSVLNRLRSMWWWDEHDRCARLVWPIWDVEGDLIGWVGRRLDKNVSERKYRNAPAMEVLSTLWPLPIGSPYPEQVLVLVEGPYDAIRLLQNGIPALSMLGTNWSRARDAIVAAMGIERVVLALDGDSAGRDGMDKIGWKIANLVGDDNLLIWNWPKGEDPGSASLKEVLRLKSAVLPKGTPPGLHPWLRFTPKPRIDWYPDTPK